MVWKRQLCFSSGEGKEVGCTQTAKNDNCNCKITTVRNVMFSIVLLKYPRTSLKRASSEMELYLPWKLYIPFSAEATNTPHYHQRLLNSVLNKKSDNPSLVWMMPCPCFSKTISLFHLSDDGSVSGSCSLMVSSWHDLKLFICICGWHSELWSQRVI